MINFELTLGDLYSAQLNYYDITTAAGSIEVLIVTNRGGVKYEITSAHDTDNNLVSMRDEIAKKLNTSNCWIKEDEKNKVIYFDGISFSGKREKADFLPRKA